ncbi:LOW QUALITY PROTEIN: hypothetical protein TorRG33x02_099040, partial [Trema orientale]
HIFVTKRAKNAQTLIGDKSPVTHENLSGPASGGDLGQCWAAKTLKLAATSHVSFSRLGCETVAGGWRRWFAGRHGGGWSELVAWVYASWWFWALHSEREREKTREREREREIGEKLGISNYSGDFMT